MIMIMIMIIISSSSSSSRTPGRLQTGGEVVLRRLLRQRLQGPGAVLHSSSAPA